MALNPNFNFRVFWPICRSVVALALLTCFFNQTQVSCARTSNETDRLALLAFKAAITDDPFEVLKSWNDSVNLCGWYGVRCDLSHQRVRFLELKSLNLSGSISPHIGNLSFLMGFSLYKNSFGQEIPQQIGQLRRLRFLDLSFNALAGDIPRDILSCSKLRILALQYNQLTGEIPREFGLLSKLQILWLNVNHLRGTIPSSIGNTSLKELYLVSNDLSGSIPESLGQLAELRELSLGNCSFSGIVPRSLYNLSLLTTFDVGMNQINGIIPANIGFTLPYLEWYSISKNQFTGPVPSSISNCTSLQFLQLSGNKLSGTMPSLENLHSLQWLVVPDNQLGSDGSNDLSFLCSLTNITSLTILDISINNLSGLLPDCICNYSTTLTTLRAQHNMISGMIPRAIKNLANLEWLQMDNNILSGTIPNDLGNLQKLSYLELSNNNFYGVIPSSFRNLTNLLRLVLSGNNFQGHIPSNFNNCQSLAWLGLSSNNFSGSINLAATNLIYLDLASNFLTMPMEIGNVKQLNYLDISWNLLYGEIPHHLSNCEALIILDMQENLFQGFIPQSLSSLRSLEMLDLSKNNLSGEIPIFLQEFKFLQYVNLSYNKFEGMVPTEGVFNNASATFVIGNNKLCGGIHELHLPKCHFINSRGKRVVKKLKLIVSIVSGLFGVAIVLAFLSLCFLKKKRKEVISSSTEDPWQILSYGTILKATDGFSTSHLIGVGSFGLVYKGILHENGKIVAVKVLNLMCHGALKSFTAECEALKHIRHRNLLKVLTVCSGIDYKHDEFKALVYEFMVNGSLEEWLHPNLAAADVDILPKKLNLMHRINISIDVASALDYLHNQCHIPVIHCDLKPSNVLLDADMVGHVGDFGLAKIILDCTSNARVEMSSAGIRGTVGYAPPEYGVEGVVSTKGDVYSYGILLLEMFTGVSPTNEMFGENLNLHTFVKEMFPKGTLEITDPILLKERENHVSSIRDGVLKECLVKIYEIGCACSVRVPQERMIIAEVVSQLCSIRDRLNATGLLR